MSENAGPSTAGRSISTTVAFCGSQPLAEARAAARDYLSQVQGVHGIPVSERVMDMVQLVVSELVTNSRKYAPGPCLLEMATNEGAVVVSVWDTDPTMPAARETDPGRIGQHGLEIVMSVCHSFEVRRQPVGKLIRATITLADDPNGHPAGYLL
ncbi:ATP-binding protein [Streptomyces sp. NBC_00667]|uniref:ATP-binding protein n=1 Tax=unclassified Streptomyces TaxID=2593676 RepID=UPI003FA73E86